MAPVMPTGKHRIDHLKCLIDFLSHFGSRQYDLAAYENKKHDLWLDHTVDESREQFRLIGAKVMMTACKSFQANGKLNVARAYNVLDLEIRKLCVEPKFLYDSSIFAGSKLGIVFRLCASNDHLA